MTVGAIISYARKRKGWNQTFVAKQIGMKLSTYSKKESDGGFSEEQLKQLAKLLRVKYSELKTAKVNDNLIMDDAMRLMIDDLKDTKVMVHALLHSVAIVIASQRKMKIEAVIQEMKEKASIILDAELEDIT
jgi:transcriptional regulator with XRE-family HTH domain